MNREHVCEVRVATVTLSKLTGERSREGPGYVPEKDYPTVSYRFLSTV